MIGWLRVILRRPPKLPPPPPAPRDPYNGVPLHRLPAGGYHGGDLTLEESRYLRAQWAARREAMERDILDREEG